MSPRGYNATPGICDHADAVTTKLGRRLFFPLRQPQRIERMFGYGIARFQINASRLAQVQLLVT
jgi:hypothetical protein